MAIFSHHSQTSRLARRSCRITAFKSVIASGVKIDQ